MISPGNNDWVVALVERITSESPLVKSYFFRLPHPLTHAAGQHYELRLTAENGYQAARLYSAAEPGNGDSLLRLTIMDVNGGEVSPYLSHQLSEGDTVEIRGPFGKYFVWRPDDPRPVLLVGGGSGVVPMHAILQLHRLSGTAIPMELLYGTRHYDDILFKDDFLQKDDVTITLTQESWGGHTGRIAPALIGDVISGLDAPLCYICGMSPFVDAVTGALQDLGIPAIDIKTERFG